MGEGRGRNRLQPMMRKRSGIHLVLSRENCRKLSTERPTLGLNPGSPGCEDQAIPRDQPAPVPLTSWTDIIKYEALVSERPNVHSQGYEFIPICRFMLH